MKFLIDAQLPVRLSQLLKSMGHDAIHTKELALKCHEIQSLFINKQKISIILFKKNCSKRKKHPMGASFVLICVL